MDLEPLFWQASVLPDWRRMRPRARRQKGRSRSDDVHVFHHSESQAPFCPDCGAEEEQFHRNMEHCWWNKPFYNRVIQEFSFRHRSGEREGEIFESRISHPPMVLLPLLLLPLRTALLLLQQYITVTGIREQCRRLGRRQRLDNGTKGVKRSPIAIVRGYVSPKFPDRLPAWSLERAWYGALLALLFRHAIAVGGTHAFIVFLQLTFAAPP